ncbi:Gfo/Idh/MocA family oxidoreductase [Ideonella sp.]|uniref:Gfo/Idh/MocA family protein n=1 Tax=Ideonella sp. TaxID=1929293 RepID=UPI002B4761A8|nr:Gfo/Idh/MocA family oxidoreductase [Ideonella sp.]HJV70954.1 Gfo/Idh/MocA family oxidoreductase [Ideonella sp.]
MQHTSNTDPFGWALVGPGRIAHRFAEAVHRLPDTRLVVVQGRDLDRARAFAAAWTRDGVTPVDATVELAEALARPDVHGVYIATPHAFHGHAVRAALEAGKAVLCEKPLVASLAEARPLIALARSRGVFLMEAMWTRFLPIYATVRRWLAEERIGRLRGLQSSFCFRAPYDPADRAYDPALAGGALLDLGVYNLAMTRWALQAALGDCPEPASLQAHGRLAPSGVDQRVWATLAFDGGIVSQFTCAFDGAADNGLRLFGEHGHIVVPREFWQATEAQLLRSGEPPEIVHAPFAVNGFEGEVEETMRCAREGLVESPAMRHDDTLAVLGWMGAIRSQVGVRYPFE